MENGYIKTYRCLMQSDVWQNDKLLKTWMWCLLKARHEAGTATVGQQQVDLEAGQFIFGRFKASTEIGYPESTVWRLMKTLERAGMVNIKPTNKFSVVTIVNWGLYQGSDAPVGSKVRRKRTRSEQEVDTNKNVKNVKNIIPPTLEMVTKYCLDENYPINPQAFIDYYESRGWKIGSSKMKDWQATVRNWARRESGSSAKPVQEVKKYTI